MDKLATYSQIVQELLTEYAQTFSTSNSIAEIETQVIFDRERNHYQLVNLGWNRGRRIFGVVIHIDIKEEKIWLQYNGTEEHIAERLVQMGIPAEDIVLGFHSVYKRQFTDYAIS
jgi:hypothetical protein